jgi:hypothetical protein
MLKHEGDGIEGGCFGLSPLEVHVISHRDIADVFCDFLLILFINEDEGVMFGILPIVEHPLFSGMVSLIFVAADGDVRRGGGGGCDALEERRQLILLLHDLCQIWLNEIGEGGDVSEMHDGIVFSDSDGKGQTSFVFCHGFDGDHEVIGGPCHDRGEGFIHRSIVTNGSA